MTILNILQFPDPKLRIKAQPIDNLDEKLQQKLMTCLKLCTTLKE